MIKILLFPVKASLLFLVFFGVSRIEIKNKKIFNWLDELIGPTIDYLHEEVKTNFSSTKKQTEKIIHIIESNRSQSRNNIKESQRLNKDNEFTGQERKALEDIL